MFSQKVTPIILHGYIGWDPDMFKLWCLAISQSFKCPEQNLMPWISEISLWKLLLLFISTQIRRGMLGGNWGSRLKRTGGFLLEQCRLLQLFKVISVQIEINLARPQFLCQKHTQKQTGPGLNPHCCNLKFFLLKGPDAARSTIIQVEKRSKCCVGKVLLSTRVAALDQGTGAEWLKKQRNHKLHHHHCHWHYSGENYKVF